MPRTSSGSSCSERAVWPTRSTKSTETRRRSSPLRRGSSSWLPQALQNFAASGFSWPQCAQVSMPGCREWLFVVRAERLADLLCERLGGELRLLALPAQLLDGDVARGVDLGARDHPRRPVLVPDPYVLHPQVEER